MTAFGWTDINLIPMGLLQAAEGVSRHAASSFVSSLWQGVALAFGTIVCLRVVPRTTPAIRFTVWTVVFALLALLPLLQAYLGHTAGAAVSRGAVVHVDARWSYAVALLWLMMSLVRGVHLAVGAMRLRDLWKTAVPVHAGADCRAVLSAAGLRGTQLCRSAHVDRPSVIGFFSPRILIPDEFFDRLTATELEQIVLHELGHLRRADDWINLLQKLSLVLIPLNPVLMWIERRLCIERELACDDDVLQLTQAPKAYATCLTNLAEHKLGRLGRQAATLSLGAWEKQSELARRIHRILRRGEAMGRLQARIVVGALTLTLLGGAAELSRCPQVVSFSGRTAPMMAAEQSVSSAAYQPVVFHPAPRAMRNMPGGAHETLLKASMPSPVHRPLKSGSQIAPRPRRSASTPGLLRTKQPSATSRPQQQWVVLTSWSDGGGSQPRWIIPVSSERSEDHIFSASYAAVPTADGWLVIQL